MKDPAVLFYFQDFLVGTEFMTDDEVGKYIRILCHQADKGALNYSQLQRICRSEVPVAIMEKLTEDSNGNFYQNRMKVEREKRVNYSNSRRKNRESKEDMNNICDTYDSHMENENENINIKEDKPVFNFKKSLIEIGVSEQIATDWMKVRKDKKASNTETAFKHIEKQIKLTGASANDCIKKAVEKSWCGFEADWYGKYETLRPELKQVTKDMY